jgi:hypothetical protein
VDSRLDPDKSLRDQFNLLRVSDPVSYPAFFELNGRRFEISIHANDDFDKGDRIFKINDK